MKKSVGRPSKLDKDTMREANISFFVIMIILILLLTIATLTIINTEIFDYIKASLANLF